jgi:hypothetical protein
VVWDRAAGGTIFTGWNAAQDIARDLADIASQLPSLKGDATAWLSDPNYNVLKLRLENARAAVEAAAVEARSRRSLQAHGVPVEDNYTSFARLGETHSFSGIDFEKRSF